MKKRNLVTVIIILAILLFSIYALNKNNKNIDEKIVKCINSKSMLYTKTGCLACKHQENIFGENYKYLNVINCAIDSKKCLNDEIMVVPTWIINNKKYTGARSIEQLKELTGC